jgi:hypothetical protein
MNARIMGFTALAVVISGSMAVFAQITPPPSPRPAGEAQQAPAVTPAGDPSVALVGCVERESDYRRAHSAGLGGAAGTGAGIGNEFVLVGAAPAAAATATPTPEPGAAPANPAAVGTGGAAGNAYELSGPGEGLLAGYVGRRVEIAGRMKQESMAAASKAPAVSATVPESPTGRPGGATATGSPSGRNAGQPAGGIDLTGRDLHLKEFEVVSVKEAAGNCPAAR